MRTILATTLLLTACTSNYATRLSARTATEADIALMRGDYDRAILLANQGLARRPNDPYLLYDKGAAEAGLGHTDAALVTLHRAEQLFGDAYNRSLVIYRRALVLEYAGRCNEAARELTRYAGLIGKSHPDLAKEALEHVAYCLLPPRQQAVAETDSQALAENQPNAPKRRAMQLSTESIHASIAGDYTVALAKANAALELTPEDPWLVYQRGVSLSGLGRLSEAETTLRQAEALFPADNVHGRAVSIYRRAMAFELAGRCDELAAELLHFSEVTRQTDPDFAASSMLHVRMCRLAKSRGTVF